MKVIKMVARQTSANYRIPQFLKVQYSYDLPPYSTVIGMIHAACGFEKYVDMDVSIQSKHVSRHWDLARHAEFKPDYSREEYLKNNKYDTVVVSNNKKTGIMKTNRKIQILDELTHVFHIKVKDETLLEQIKQGLLHPKEYLSLGRREDLLVVESVKIVNVKKEDLNSYKMKYNTYVPVEYLKNKENIGTVFHINKKYEIDTKSNLRKWIDVADVVLYTEGDVVAGKYYIDTEKDIVFLR